MHNNRVASALHRASAYAHSHIWVPLSLSVLVTVLMIALISQSYLKNQYLEYLLQGTYRTEQAVLESERDYIDSSLTDDVSSASELATNSKLRQQVDSYLSESKTGSTVALSRALSMATTEKIVCVALVTKDGLLYQYDRHSMNVFTNNVWGAEDADTLKQIYSKVLDSLSAQGIQRYVAIATPNVHPRGDNMLLMHLAVPLLGSYSDLDSVNTVLIISFNMEVLNHSLSQAALNKGMSVAGYLTDAQGTIIYHKSSAAVGQTAAQYLAEAGLENMSIQLKHFGWSLNIALDKSGLMHQVDLMYARGLLVLTVLLVLAAMILLMLIQWIMRPVNDIRSAIRAVRHGSLEQKIEIHGTHEIWQLAEQYNRMVDSLRGQQQETERQHAENVEALRRASAAEMKTLESQIDAHFLCNTLNAINYTAMDAGDKEVSTMLVTLSDILRYAFSRTAQSVTMGQEINWVKEYLCLQKYRLGDKFDYTIDFPEQYGEWPCCKLFLQPFVENSIHHGFRGLERGGRLAITGQAAGGRLQLELTDNGCGIAPGTEALLQKILHGETPADLCGVGIGICNVVARLRIYYGPEFALALETQPGKGTCFRFLIPIPASMQQDVAEDGEEAEI
jgi:sensor histidine kinase YesM